jgi:DNA-binding NarL/FixJ family response regulator
VADRIRVLLADPSASARLVLRALLADDDRFEVVGEAGTGAGAIAAAGTADLVVTDLVFPDGDAFTVAETIHATHPKLPVVVLAAVDPQYLRAEAAGRGVAAYYSKAADPAGLVEGLAGAAGVTHH